MELRVRKLILLGGLSLLLVGLIGGSDVGSAARTAARAPHTLAIANARIETFAQDAGAIAWIDSGRKVQLQRLSDGRRWNLGWSSGGGPRSSEFPPLLALAGTRALWTEYSGGNSLEIVLKTGAPADAQRRATKRATWVTLLGNGDPLDCADTSSYFSGLAGGDALLYANVAFDPVPRADVCRHELSGGGVVQVTRPSVRKPPRLREIPAVAAPTPILSEQRGWTMPHPLAVSRGRLAVLPPRSVVPFGEQPTPDENGPVTVSTLSGAQVSEMHPAGTVSELALAWPQLAVLVARADGGLAVERYDARTGRYEDATPVPGTATDLALGSGGVVYRVGRTIYTIRGGRPVLLWHAQAVPIGLSVEGRRVAWAVNLGARGRIVGLTLG